MWLNRDRESFLTALEYGVRADLRKLKKETQQEEDSLENTTPSKPSTVSAISSIINAVESYKVDIDPSLVEDEESNNENGYVLDLDGEDENNNINLDIVTDENISLLENEDNGYEGLFSDDENDEGDYNTEEENEDSNNYNLGDEEDYEETENNSLDIDDEYTFGEEDEEDENNSLDIDDEYTFESEEGNEIEEEQENRGLEEVESLETYTRQPETTKQQSSSNENKQNYNEVLRANKEAQAKETSVVFPSKSIPRGDSGNIKYEPGMPLDEFLRKNPTLRTENDILGFYSREDIQRYVRLGKILFKKGRIIL